MNWLRAASVSAWLGVLAGCISLAGSQEATSGRITVSDDAMRGVLVKKVAPVYPPLARQARIQGTVILKVVIDKSGNVLEVRPVSGHPMLAPAAVDAVRQWKYQPYLVNGEPVEVETDVQVIFKIEGEPAPPTPAENAPGTGPGEVPGGVPGAGPALPQVGIIGGIVQATPGDSNATALPKRIRVSSGVARQLLISKVNPEYPPDAREQGVQGVVFLKVNIDKEGNVYRAELISGHPLLAPAAIEAVKQWKYKPFLLNGQAIEVETQIQVNFTLTEK